MIFDVTTFNGEYDLFELRYQILKDYVDEFIVLEFDTTFSGKPKEIYSESIVSNYPDTVKFMWRDGNNFSEEEKIQAWNSPNTIGAAHWTREFLQKESIKSALTHLNDDDLVFIGDVDEIWSPTALKHHKLPLKLKLGVYTYYLNNKSSEEFWGTLMAPYALIKNQCLNHLRTHAPKSKHLNGWHFTSMTAQLHKKLTDSYTHESYATPTVLENLAYNIEHNRDFLGRDFTYELNEAGWPTYLKQNREQYKHLLSANAANSS